jgi:hypothetical protein
MFPIDPLWVYIAVPAVLVSILILIKLRQKEMDHVLAREFLGEEREEGRPSEEEATKESLAAVKKTQTAPETQEKTKPQGCLNYLGYLYMRQVPDRTHIPTECYNCLLLLKCLYSPVIVEKVYGE